MGTTSVFYALVRDQPYIQETLSVFIALGPVTKVGSSTSPLIHLFAKPLRAERFMLDKLGIYTLFQPDWLQDRLMWAACGFVPILCELGAEALATTNFEADD